MSRLDAMARHMWDARRARQRFDNLPKELHPGSIAEAYQAQEVYYRLAEPVYGPVAGVKVATTTRVMQELMGITHPCGGAIFARTIHASPARIAKSDFVNLRVESEIALKLGADMPAAKAPWSADTVAPFVAGAMPAYELIEDRNAVYTETNAVSMIVENCWNGGVVIGAPKAVDPKTIIGIVATAAIASRSLGVLEISRAVIPRAAGSCASSRCSRNRWRPSSARALPMSFVRALQGRRNTEP